MRFDSTVFLFAFLPVTLIVYHLAPRRWKNPVLAAASILFYAWGSPFHAAVILLLTGWNFLGGKRIYMYRNKPKRMRAQLRTAVVVNVAVLVLVKCVGRILGLAGSSLADNMFFALPVGLSIVVLQSISYQMDIASGEARPQKRFADFAVLTLMFPKGVCGPLVSCAEFDVQEGTRRVTWSRAGDGAMLFVRGLAKKVVLGSSMYAVFTEVWSMSGSQTSCLSAWIGCAAFALSVIFDLEGYCDMGKGLGRLFGFELPDNMDAPCFSIGIMDFWSRFFRTLWDWFCKYVYMPLCERFRAYPDTKEGFLCLAGTWVLIGLWHGFRLTFVIWGLFFAALIYLEGFVLGKRLTRIPAPVRWIVTTALLLISWVFFFSDSLGEMGGYLLRMIGVGGHGFADAGALSLVSGHLPLWVVALLTQIPIVRDIYRGWVSEAGKWQVIANTVIYGLLFVLCIAVVLTNTQDTFFYFRF